MRLRALVVGWMVVAGAACAGTLENREQFVDGDGGADASPASQCPDVPSVVLAPTCGTAGCHAPPTPQSALDLVSPNVASRVVGVAARSGGLLVDPDHPEQSLIYRKLRPGAPGSRMPIGRVLDDATIACVLSWAEGVSGTGRDAGIVGPADAGLRESSTSDSGTGTADAGTVLRVASGRMTPFIDHDRNVWSADTSFTGGQTVEATPPLTIDKTMDGPLYNSERYGSFSYAFAVANGRYNVTLKFAETYAQIAAAGQRQFNVSVNGQQVLTNFDIFAEAGGRDIAVDKSFPIDVTGGNVAIVFAPGPIQSPKVDAISIVPQ